MDAFSFYRNAAMRAHGRPTRLPDHFGLALLVLSCCALAGCSRSDPSANQREVPRSALEFKDHRLYLPGQPAPFTGFITEHYAGGGLQSRSSVSNGVLQGISEGWHTNGLLQVREVFAAGFSQGLRTKWYPSGARQSEATIVHGKLEGPFRRWDEHGALLEQIELRNDQPDGTAVAFYPSGCVKTWARMQAGRILERRDFEDGQQKPPLNLAASK